MSIHTTRFETNRKKLFVEVEGDHIYVGSECCGCGDWMDDIEEMERLRDDLTAMLERAKVPH